MENANFRDGFGRASRGPAARNAVQGKTEISGSDRPGDPEAGEVGAAPGSRCIAVHRAKRFRPVAPGAAAKDALGGRGGADFRPGFARLSEQGLRPGCRLCLTDMVCDRYPETEPGYPVVWCNWGPPPGERNRQPWGERIDMAGP